MGLQSSAHAQPAATAVAILDEILTEVQRRDTATRKIFNLVARSLDSIAAACKDEEKPIAQEINDLFASFLTTNLLSAKKGGGPMPANEPNGGVAANWAGAGKSSTKPQTTQQKETGQKTTTEDIRILARLPQEQLEWSRSVRNFALRTALCDQVGLSLADIPNVYHTATGFAIHPRNKEVRQGILAKEKEAGLCLRATKLELPIKWYKAAEPRQRVPVQDHLSPQDWLLLAEIQSLLKPLNEITMRCQGWAKEGRYGALWEVMIGMEYLLNFFEEQKLIFSPPAATADKPRNARALAATSISGRSGLQADQVHGREKHLPEHTRDEYTSTFSEAGGINDDHRRCIQISINNCWSKLDEYYTLLGQSPLYPAAIIFHPRWNVSWLEANWTSCEQLVWLRDAKNSIREYFEQHFQPMSHLIK